MPVFSVIIPTYNRADYVQCAIDSVLAQTYKDVEIIVVDDGSTDGTANALGHYGAKIRYLSQPNAGVSSARNHGISVAAGSWLAFLDSDDELLPDYFQNQYDLISRYPAAVASLLNAEDVDGALKREKFSLHGLSNVLGAASEAELPKPFAIVIGHHLALLHTCVFRRDVVAETRKFDENLRIDEDLDFIGQVALRGPLVLSKAIGARVIRRVETTPSLSAQFHLAEVRTRTSRELLYARFADEPSLDLRESHVVAERRCANLRAMGNRLLRQGARDDAERAYRKALDLHPAWATRLKYVVFRIRYLLNSAGAFRSG